MPAQPEPYKLLSRKIADLEEQVRQLRNRSPFANAGMSVTAPGEVTVDGNLIVSGDFTAEGKISNDALVNPVVPKSAHADAAGFSVSAAWSTKCSATVSIPTGCTKALLSATVNCSALNGSAGMDWLYASLSVTAYGGSLPGWVISSPNALAGTYTSAFDSRALLLTGLTPGASFTIEAQVSTGGASWGSDAQNEINLDSSILFLR